MRMARFVVAASVVSVATAAQAQVDGVNLTGRYQCVRGCASDAPDQFAFVTQNGWELNLINEAGVPSRGWINYPGRLWIDRAQTAGIYAPDGLTVQFDNGTLWQRVFEVPAPPPPPPPPRRHRVGGLLPYGLTQVRR